MVLLQVLHHVRRGLALRDQFSEAEFADRSSVFFQEAVRSLPVSEMLPQFGVVGSARRIEVSQLANVLKRLVRNCRLRGREDTKVITLL